MRTGLLIQGSFFHDSLEGLLKEFVECFDEVVISTWYNVIVPEVDGVRYVRLVDPGSDPIQTNGVKRTNYRRHLFGVTEGLRQMSSEKVVKVRSDISFNAKALLNLEWDENMLLVSNVTSKTYSPLHVSDWIHMAKRVDLISCYSNYRPELFRYLSFEEYIALQFVLIDDSKYINQFSAKKINVKSFKRGYVLLPLDLNIVFRPNKLRIDKYNEGDMSGYMYGLNSFLVLRIFSWYLYRVLRRFYHWFK